MQAHKNFIIVRQDIISVINLLQASVLSSRNVLNYVQTANVQRGQKGSTFLGDFSEV